MSKELKTGVISLIIIALGIWGYNFLKGQDLFNPNSRSFKVKYNNISGLSKASLVTINGLKVGKIERIEFDKNAVKKGGLIVHFSMDNDFEFSKNSIVKIYSPSPLGGSNLAIIPDYEGENAVSGDFLTGEVETSLFSSIGERLDPIQTKLDNVLLEADTLLVGLNKVLDKKAQRSLNRSVGALEGTISDVRTMLKSVNSLIETSKASVELSLKNTEKITSDFTKVSEDLTKANISGTVKKLETTLENVNGLLVNMENGKGTLGKLITDEQMYNNLTKASKEMAELLREMKLNPKRFVHFSLFGKKAKPYNEENNKNNTSNK